MDVFINSVPPKSLVLSRTALCVRFGILLGNDFGSYPCMIQLVMASWSTASSKEVSRWLSPSMGLCGHLWQVASKTSEYRDTWTHETLVSSGAHLHWAHPCYIIDTHIHATHYQFKYNQPEIVISRNLTLIQYCYKHSCYNCINCY